MTDNRKILLAEKHRLEIRRTVALLKLADYGYHLVEAVVDAEIEKMLERLTDISVSDKTLLRELVYAELWPRLRETAAQLRHAAYEQFVIENPDVVNIGSEFAMDTGWVGLLQIAAARLRTYPAAWKVALTGGKEKFGCLVLHIDCDYSARGCRSEVERLREEIRLRSLSTCEVCGASGRLRISSFAKTLCDKHVGILGDLREDDGRWSDPWKWHEDGDEYPASAAEHLREMEQVRPRPIEQVIAELSRLSEIGKRIEEDVLSRVGREHELLIEFCGLLEDSAKGACVKEQYLDDYVRDEVAGWTGVQPLSDDDREFLRIYLRQLIDQEYERVRVRYERFVADFGDGLDFMQELQRAAKREGGEG
jgi:hypothetical protein